MEFPADKHFDEAVNAEPRKELALMLRIAQLADFAPRLRDRLAEGDMTMPDFIEEFNFPLWLQWSDVRIYPDLDEQLRKRFTRTTIFTAWSDLQEDLPVALGLPSGIAFYWAHVGRHMLFHDRSVFPTGGSGQYFYRKQPKKLFILQRLEDFIDEIGTGDEW